MYISMHMHVGTLMVRSSGDGHGISGSIIAAVGECIIMVCMSESFTLFHLQLSC
jgi:hypothetical protein